MKKILKWTLVFHLILFGPLLSALIAGLAYSEKDNVRSSLSALQVPLNAAKNIFRSLSPWL